MSLKDYTALQAEISALTAKKDACKADAINDIKKAIEFFGIMRRDVFEPVRTTKRPSPRSRSRTALSTAA